ncbi:hypothetical protein NQ317_012331 [Molorchus minor]|uniref:Uncharacterized protein n=1 Tax=Molorchus minor TaxID=1323400 RepID=A0ABQ9IS42_9CUCU|nr:hypothetical protein NQ317_012331 [Molorchus minor]
MLWFFTEPSKKAKSPDEDIFGTSSLQTVLDSVRTPRSVVISGSKENLENKAPTINRRNVKNSTKTMDKYRINLLEEAYFGKVFPKKCHSDTSEDFEVSFVDSANNSLFAGAEICQILLHLYNIYDSHTDSKRRACVAAALTGLLCISKEAKRYALEKGLCQLAVSQLKEFHIRLSLESVDSLKRVSDRRRVCPILKEVGDIVSMLTNFMVNDETVKVELASLNLADVVHKLWVWFLAQNVYVADVLRMLYVYTAECVIACQSLTLTSPVAGSGPRKTLSNVSLLHTLVNLIVKEMEQVSKTHNMNVLEVSFNILHNSCDSLECRILLSKSNLFQSISRLHPAITKRQKPWENIELIWLAFIQTFTTYPEGQASVVKVADVLDLIITLASSTRPQNRLAAISGDFLNILNMKMTSGSKEEKNIVTVIMWALAANSQRAKIILKSAHLDVKLQNTIKHGQVIADAESKMSSDELEKMYYVLNMLRDGDKVR